MVPELLWLSCDGMMVIDEDRRILAMNPALERLTGHRSEQVVGKSVCGVLLDCHDAQGCPLMERAGECPGLRAMQRFEPVPHAEYTILTAAGTRRAISASYTPIQTAPGRPIWAVVVMRDVTLQQRRERRLARQAMRDPLTGLWNRTALKDTFTKELKRAVRHRRPLAVLVADIDGFKRYNDTYGHLAGDALLKALAGVLRAGRRATDLVVRYGGDEFVLLLPETDVAGGMVVAERVGYLIPEFPFVVPEHPAVPSRRPVTISVGVAVFPEDGVTTEALLAAADARLYEAKRQGGRRVVGPSAPPQQASAA